MKGPDIRALRKRLGLKQTEIASQLGVSVFTITRWERGVVSPSQMGLAALQRLIDSQPTGRSHAKDVRKPTVSHKRTPVRIR